MARSDPQFNLRVPVDLKEKIELAAKQNGRSINAEAVARLQGSFSETEVDQSKVDSLIEQVTELLKKIDTEK